MESVDLLGLSPPASPKRPSTPPPVVAPAQEIQQPSQQHAVALEAPTPAPAPPPKPALPSAAKWSGGSNPSGRSFVVRCKDRWRVRAEPGLSAKVLGTVGNGTVVVAAAEDEVSASQSPDPLWIRAARFETSDPQGISEMQCDPSSGSQMWCLRRNALGFGLYEVGVEDNCELQALSEELSEALRATTIAGISESTEGVSTTWKLLSAADTVSSFVSSWAPVFGPMKSEETVEQFKNSREHAESVFERRQREQLIAAAKLLNQSIEKQSSVRTQANSALPTDVQRRLERLCELLPPAERAKQPTPENVLMQTSEICGRVGKSGMVPAQHRQEFIASCQRLASDLEEHVRTLKLKQGTTEASLLDTRSGGYAGKSSNQSIGVPLLAPPPPPKAGVASSQLIF